MSRDQILAKLRMPFDADEYEAIRALWKKHSIAEDERDIGGLMSTLTDDCVYEMIQTGHRWEGHAGATRFYTDLLTAMPDVDFALTDIVIGPQGVFEMADVTATHQGEWLGWEPTGKEVGFTVVIFFPWDSEARLFTGERIWFHGIIGIVPAE